MSASRRPKREFRPPMTEHSTRKDASAGRDRVLLGAALVAAAGLMFALAGMAIKMAGASLSSVEVLFWRNVLSLAILAPWILWHWPPVAASGTCRPDGAARRGGRGVAALLLLRGQGRCRSPRRCC